jgi:hypothetical protein
MKQILLIYNNLINMPNVEVIYLQCKNNNINLTRVYRFLPFIDDTVCYVNIREADGIVNFNDCLNIRNLERSNDKFILISNFDKFSKSGKASYGNFNYFSYNASWNNKVKNNINIINNRDSFTDYKNLISYPAGAFTLKYKIIKKHFQDNINKCNDIVFHFNLRNILKKEKKVYHLDDDDDNNHNKIYDLINNYFFAFDEIFLMNLLDGVQQNNFLGYKYNKSELDIIIKTYIFIRKNISKSDMINDEDININNYLVNDSIKKYNKDLNSIIKINKFEDVEYLEYDDNIESVYDLDYFLKNNSNI